ncbi:Uncharacterised protein [Vibrio cholerae]|nr:Uncharacterised protein [Vibrio cholerae]CSI82520.1 Uncharacterised protein [Vibrio cholerae]
MVGLWANQWINRRFVDQFWSFFCHFLNFHATFSRCHENDTTCRTVNYRTKIKLISDI